ncbi:MAG: hypothetical protein WAQ28_10890 [Bacteroidia bacterium]|jgi:hypothetical protein
MFNDRFKNILNDRGFLLTGLLSLVCMFLFLGKVLVAPNQVYFKASDDGIQSYYASLYHVKYDSTYWHFQGMNYPYGEHVLFTGCQPLITNPIKLVSKVVDVSNYTLGIINMIMLLSVALCPFFLYFIFKHLKLPWLFSAIAAIAITFLSPQFIRMGGHFALTYQFAIPLFLLLLIKFHESPSVKKSIWISVFVFLMACTQFYFFGFFAIISFVYWLFMLFRKTPALASETFVSKIKFCFKHSLIQLVLPFVLIQVFMLITDPVHDRTGQPWGYLAYFTNLAGVFFPLDKPPYTDALLSFIKPEYPPSMEGYSYIGLLSTAAFLLLVLIAVKKLFFLKFRKVLLPTDNAVLNAFFWAGIIALLLAFGYPFRIQGYERWLNSAGPLKQLRAVGRFAWVFYYVINVVVFYSICQWVAVLKPLWKNTILSLVLSIMCLDAYYTANNKQGLFNNRIPRLEDKQNQSAENKWLTELNPENYQAIIGLPYFHVGSENIWIAPATEMVRDVFINSLKTGLPTTMVSLSRTSLEQTYRNIQIIQEPYRELKILSSLKSNKPFLVLVRESELNEREKQVLSVCRKIKETPLFNVYELSLEQLSNKHKMLYSNAINAMNARKTYIIDGFNYTDSVKTFVYNGFEDKPNENSFAGKGCYEAKLKEFNVLYNNPVPNFKGEQEYTVSFWLNNYTEDLYPRTYCIIEGYGSQGSYNRLEFPMWYEMKIIDNNHALIEHKLNIKEASDHLVITIFHNDFASDKKLFQLDELLIRPSKDTIYRINDAQSIMCNNRIYLNK